MDNVSNQWVGFGTVPWHHSKRMQKLWRVVWMFGRSFPQHILTVLRQWQLQMMPGREILGREVLKYARWSHLTWHGRKTSLTTRVEIPKLQHLLEQGLRFHQVILIWKTKNEFTKLKCYGCASIVKSPESSSACKRTQARAWSCTPSIAWAWRVWGLQVVPFGCCNPKWYGSEPN